MIIRKIRKYDIDKVINLHINTLKETTSSRIGFQFVKSLYIASLKNTINSCFVIEKDKNIIGATLVTQNIFDAQKISQPIQSLKLSSLILMALIKRRINLYDLWIRYSFEVRLKKIFKAPFPMILTFYISRSEQNKGYGKRLLNKIINWYRLKKFTKIYVDTTLNNSQAQTFYKKAGFRKKRIISNSILYQKQIL